LAVVVVPPIKLVVKLERSGSTFGVFFADGQPVMLQIMEV
jgi:hypothetical protein